MTAGSSPTHWTSPSQGGSKPQRHNPGTPRQAGNSNDYTENRHYPLNSTLPSRRVKNDAGSRHAHRNRIPFRREDPRHAGLLKGEAWTTCQRGQLTPRKSAQPLFLAHVERGPSRKLLRVRPGIHHETYYWQRGNINRRRQHRVTPKMG